MLVNSHQAFLTLEALSEIARVMVENVRRFLASQSFLEGTVLQIQLFSPVPNFIASRPWDSPGPSATSCVNQRYRKRFTNLVRSRSHYQLDQSVHAAR